MMSVRLHLACAIVLAVLGHVAVGAQWTNRYPKVEGFNHHVYLEGYELPTMGAGPTDPAASPDGQSLAVSARGWLWLLDVQSGEARRVTRGSGMDSRPAWSPDGRRVAFVRDTGKDTRLMEVDAGSGTERVLVDTPAIDLDPVYSRDGKHLYYSSAVGGDFDLWRLDLATNAQTRLTEDKGLELRPLPLPGDGRVVFVSKGDGSDKLAVLNPEDNSRRVLDEYPIASQMRPALHPDGRSVVVGFPNAEDWDLWLVDVNGGPPIRIAAGGMPLMPAWSADGASVLFVEASRERQFRLRRVGRGGGGVSELPVLAWNWGEPTTRVQIRTRRQGANTPLASRVQVVDRDGHPALPDSGQVWFDGQNGIVYSYSPGVLTVEVPAGEVRVTASAGFGAAAVSASANATPGQVASVDLQFAPIWNAQADGWYSGDHHFHMNYGGPYTLQPDDLVLMMRGEDLDVGTPLTANLHTRLTDPQWFDWTRTASGVPLIAFGQEVRPHFLGHMSLIGVSSPHWPWYWGPGYPTYGRDDRPNVSALSHARRQGGVNAYVHPVMRPGPFSGGGQAPSGLPLGLVPDAVLGDLDTIELACLWSDELGTTDAWYRLLNIGATIAPSAGTDVMTNFYRTMAIGTTRVYVKPDGPLTLDSYLAALRGGRSFVTTGPLPRFTAQGAGPGGLVTAKPGADVAWEMTVASPLAFDTVEVLVNGVVVWSDKGLSAPGTRTWSGRVKAPAGGWMAARVRGGAVQWPAMDSYPFAHTAPVWFGSVGSTDRRAARAAAVELLKWMDVADKRLDEGFAGTEIPKLKARFAGARRRLETIAASGPAGSSQ
jgi:TolB protein